MKVTVWTGEEFVQAISEQAPEYPPKKFCLSENFTETSAFIEKIRRRLLRSANKNLTWLAPKNAHRSYNKIKGFFDFAHVESIETSAALVLAAEYARIGEIMGIPPIIVDLEKWEPEVFNKLFQIGFFDTVGLNEEEIPKFDDGDPDLLTLRFFTGKKQDTCQVDEALLNLAKFACPAEDLPSDIAVPVLTAISEAMTNVTSHAYPSDYRFHYRHLGQWWVTGSARKSTKTITISIYDQGATIPVTYPRQHLSDTVRKWIGLIPESANPFALDGRMIQAASKFGNSQTDLPERGKGIPQMKEAVELSKGGMLRILSRGGEYIYRADGSETVQDHPMSIGGTLIEWTIDLSEKIVE